MCPECGTHTGKKELNQRIHFCPECGYSTSRDHASGRVILNRGLKSVVRLDESERKLTARMRTARDSNI
ncbi:MAG: zinc ribbon domain-containing protein [Xenococcaceae cyanobacterium MO_207.B15]|nr:zinc ribbon domain-containing protein [Xenococcaceae cyanobacterium MO_207.B15]